MRWIARAGVTLAAALASLLGGASTAAALDLQTVGSYSEPVYVTSDPRNPDRLFVVERKGRIAQTTPAGTSTFVDLTPQVRSDDQEQGLLSMAFAPDYASSGRFYVFYTRRDSALQVAELRATGGAADAATLRRVVAVPHADNDNHNGGQLQFGPDGYLYVSTGDGGGGNDPDGNAQNLDSGLGKILRIDPIPGGGFRIPPDNPWAGQGPVRAAVWSLGLRNPYRFSFDRLTGALAIGDVGQADWEEVNYSTGPQAGRAVNYGWDCREGTDPGDGPGPTPCTGVFTDPVHQYENDPASTGCAITGGYVVRDPGLSELYGRYVYADFCVGEIRSLVPQVPAAQDDRYTGEAVRNVSSFGEDACGRVYVASLTDGTVSRLVDSTPTICPTAPPPVADCTVRIDGDGKGNRLSGGPGSQLIAGNGGRDRIRGGDGDDCIEGGRGDDVLNGNGGRDRVDGGGGADVIRARDGERDRVACGKGRDRAILDLRDRAKGCERKARKAA